MQSFFTGKECWTLTKTNIAGRLFRNRSQNTSKNAVRTSVTYLVITSCATSQHESFLYFVAFFWNRNFLCVWLKKFPWLGLSVTKWNNFFHSRKKRKLLNVVIYIRIRDSLAWLECLETRSAFLLTGKTGENCAPDGTVQFFLGKKWNGSSCTIWQKFTFSWESLGAKTWQQQTWLANLQWCSKFCWMIFTHFT